MKRTAMAARTVPLSRRAPLPRQRPHSSPKATGWPQDVRDTVQARSGGHCEARTLDCTGQATDLHHRQRRREGLHTAANALHCCRTDHAFIHANPAIARAAGWIVSAWADPATVPVRVFGRLVLLTDDGRYVAEVTS